MPKTQAPLRCCFCRIFADSTLSRDYAAPGRLDLDAIRANVKRGLTNILFCHHALSHGHGDPHDVVEDSATVIAYLNSVSISYFFHGHVHDANVTIPETGLVEIGCGSLVSLRAVQHNFSMRQRVNFTSNKNHAETFLRGIVSAWL